MPKPSLKLIFIILGSLFALFLLGIALLSLILLPAFQRAHIAAQETTVMANMRGITYSATMYATDYEGVLPPHLAPLLPYGVTTKHLRDPRNALPPMPTPASGTPWPTIAPAIDANSDYTYLAAGLHLRLSNIPNPGITPLLISHFKTRNGDYTLAFADAHIENISPQNLPRYFDELNKLRTTQNLPPMQIPF